MSIKRDLPDTQWTRAAYILMSKFHWSYNDLLDLPLSTFMELQELLKWEQKEIEKESKRRK